MLYNILMANLIPSIIYEDAFILVINKPSGLVVNRAETVREKLTVMDWLESSVGVAPLTVQIPPKGISEFEMRRGVVHRLDKDTSGVMVIAKTEKAFLNLQKQFKERAVRKEYIALVHDNGGQTLSAIRRKLADEVGPQKSQKFIVDAPIGRNPKNRMKWAVVEGGRNAVTEFNILAVNEFGNSHERLGDKSHAFLSEFSLPAKEVNGYVLLRCIPKTGRTHQIRVHLAAINCPVVCDRVYLNKRRYKEDLKWCPRLLLHAEKIGFKHPEKGEWVEYEAKLGRT